MESMRRAGTVLRGKIARWQHAAAPGKNSLV